MELFMRRLVFLGAAALLLVLDGAALRAQPALTLYAQPQTLAALADGRKINLVCQGPNQGPSQDQGAPAVILTAGAGDWSASWNAVQPLVARTMRVCAWDRPGFGHSDPSPAPQSAANLAEDLAAALKAANIPAPYVLVAHSAGVFETLQFADRHRGDVAGLVLVDPSLPDMVSRVGAISPAAQAMLRGDLANRAGAYQRCAANPAAPSPADTGICFRLPDHARPLAEHFAARDHDAARLSTRASLFAQFEINARLMNDPVRHYGNLPLAVLTSEKTPVAALPVDLPARAALEKLWNSGHDEMAALSRRGSNRVVPGAGHQIQLEQPGVVADAIARVTEQARER
jgi:pimeloyl-ACP methyl ester carboxylesterase